MLVWEVPDPSQNVFSRGIAAEGGGLAGGHGSYFSSVNRIILRENEQFFLVPNKLSMAILGAFKGLGGRVAHCAETSYAQWQQFVICASQAATRRTHVERALPLLARPAMAVRRAKAFFIAQKVNGRNAP